MSQFTRTFPFPRLVATAVKAAKTLGCTVVSMTAKGTWRSLQPDASNNYTDFHGPFKVRQGVGPAFVRDDGAECFMVDDTALVEVTFDTGE